MWLPRGRREEWKFGVSRSELLYTIGWINNKVLLYSTGNYSQYSITNHNGREYIYEHTHIKNIALLYRRN